MSTIIQMLTFLGAVSVLIQSIFCINAMSRNTHHLVRVAYIMIATGSFAEIYSIMAGRIPTLEESVFVMGVGLMTLADRRELFRCPYHKEGNG